MFALLVLPHKTRYIRRNGFSWFFHLRSQTIFKHETVNKEDQKIEIVHQVKKTVHTKMHHIQITAFLIVLITSFTQSSFHKNRNYVPSLNQQTYSFQSGQNRNHAKWRYSENEDVFQWKKKVISSKFGFVKKILRPKLQFKHNLINTKINFKRNLFNAKRRLIQPLINKKINFFTNLLQHKISFLRNIFG